MLPAKQRRLSATPAASRVAHNPNAGRANGFALHCPPRPLSASLRLHWSVDGRLSAGQLSIFGL